MFKQLTKQLLLLGLPLAVLLYCLAPFMVYYTESVLYTEMSSVYHLRLSVWDALAFASQVDTKLKLLV